MVWLFSEQVEIMAEYFTAALIAAALSGAR
jgi:hypothetical protein